MFTHIHHELPKSERIDTSSGRFYACPNQKGDIFYYPSVTSILASDESKKHILQNWKDAVGDEYAAKVSRKSSARGTRVHSLVEDYLSNKEVICGIEDIEIWTPMKKVLKENITEIHAIEAKLFSHHLKCAGTVDLIAVYKGKLTVIDIKTSSKLKYASDIPHYFQQCSAYAVMWEELTNMPVNRLQIIMGCDDSVNTLLYESKRDLHIKDFIKLRKDYAKNFESGDYSTIH
jgi:genome maintenance exonuclease 1